MSLNIAIECVNRLRNLDRCGYSADGAWTAEPTALASLALAAHDEPTAALRLARQLADAQQSNGVVPATTDADSPPWTTSLAILAWLACDRVAFAANLESAIRWTLAEYGKPLPLKPQIGHDTTLLGWSWAVKTHSWLEPTAFFVLALRAAGLDDHPRTREGVRLITDRLLPEGGCNFGSTMVLGQYTLPHVEATGVALFALAGEENSDPRVEKSLRYLKANLASDTPAASLSYGVMGLTAHSRRPALADNWLAAATEKQIAREPSAFKLALLLLASMPDNSWLPTKFVIPTGAPKVVIPREACRPRNLGSNITRKR
jgi:hypothetical protein